MILSYAITVHNELHEITRLLDFLRPRIDEDDEIIIQYDSDSVTKEVLDFIKIQDKLHKNHHVFGFPLKNDFASFKNNLKQHCSGDYISQIDADEVPHEHLVYNLKQVLETNPVDVIFVPRINTVDEITKKFVDLWGWKISKLESQVAEKKMVYGSEEYDLLEEYDLIIDVNEEEGTVKYYKPIINPWDYQTRVYKNTKEVMWMNKVHEKITGYNTFSNFPPEEKWSLYHHKELKRQIEQNEYYDTI